MKRIMPMVVAGMFVATAAFAQVDETETPTVPQETPVLTDTIPTQDQVTPPATTFPTQTESVETDTAPVPMVTEPIKTDDQTKVEEDTTTYPVIKQEDTTETDTTGNGW